jgi:Transcriptional antiterminator
VEVLAMEEYVTIKVLNNNVIIAEKENKEYILVGKGIGFNLKQGTKVASTKVESIFIKQSVDINKNYDRVLQDIEAGIVGISEEIIALCEKELKIKLNEALHVSLPDHINFAIRRIKQGVKIENPFLYELKVLYPIEYKLAEAALNMINNALKIQLPIDEIGFICMHIKAASSKNESTTPLAYTRNISDIMEFISMLIKKKIDKDSLAYVRTVTHVNFLVDRVKNNKTVKNNLLDNIKKDLYNQYDIAIKVAMKMENLFSISIPEDEVGYIAMHLTRLMEI